MLSLELRLLIPVLGCNGRELSRPTDIVLPNVDEGGVASLQLESLLWQSGCVEGIMFEVRPLEALSTWCMDKLDVPQILNAFWRGASAPSPSRSSTGLEQTSCGRFGSALRSTLPWPLEFQCFSHDDVVARRLPSKVCTWLGLVRCLELSTWPCFLKALRRERGETARRECLRKVANSLRLPTCDNQNQFSASGLITPTCSLVQSFTINWQPCSCGNMDNISGDQLSGSSSEKQPNPFWEGRIIWWLLNTSGVTHSPDPSAVIFSLGSWHVGGWAWHDWFSSEFKTGEISSVSSKEKLTWSAFLGGEGQSCAINNGSKQRCKSSGSSGADNSWFNRVTNMVHPVHGFLVSRLQGTVHRSWWIPGSSHNSDWTKETRFSDKSSIEQGQSSCSCGSNKVMRALRWMRYNRFPSLNQVSCPLMAWTLLSPWWVLAFFGGSLSGVSLKPVNRIPAHSRGPLYPWQERTNESSKRSMTRCPPTSEIGWLAMPSFLDSTLLLPKSMLKPNRAIVGRLSSSGVDPATTQIFKSCWAPKMETGKVTQNSAFSWPLLPNWNTSAESWRGTESWLQVREALLPMPERWRDPWQFVDIHCPKFLMPEGNDIEQL